MDAKTMVSLLIVKLQNLFPEDKEKAINSLTGMAINPRTQQQVKKAINNLQLWRRFLKDDDDSTNDQRIVSLLQGFYSAEDAIDTLPIADTLYYYSLVRWPLTGFKVLRLEFFFNNGMKKFKNVVRELISPDHQLEMKEAAKKDLEEDIDAGKSSTAILSSGNDAGGQNEQQRKLEMKEASVKKDIEDATDATDAGQSSITILSSRNDAGRPSEHQQELEMKEDAKQDIKDNNTGQNSTKSLSSGNDAGEPRLQRRWGRISDLCFEEEETNIVGRERDIKDLLLRLIPEGQDIRDNAHLTQVIALIGERGSGKTTLARSVYNKANVKQHFSKHAWVHIPSVHVFKARDVLADILIQIDRQAILNMETKTLTEEELMRRITQVLQDSRFLIVMENVETSQIWGSVLGNFCSSTQQGKIIITTCTAKYNVPREAAYSTLHVRGLSKEDSWKLFVKKARTIEVFLYSVKHEFEETILKICSALPLPIVLLGCLLSTKENKETLCLSLFHSYKTGRDIVALCYEELPSQLKQCFLYMGIFPREHEIPVRKLIHLWCAEGFVTPLDSKERVPEDLAESYFEELVTRNMIQVIRWGLDGIPKTCRMPGVFYDFLSQKAEDIGFFYDHQLHSSQIGTSRKPRFPVRRLAANVGSKNNIPISSLHLRSYIAFDNQMRGTPAATEIDKFLKKLIDYERIGFGILKVLEVEGVCKPIFTNAVVEQLPLLKYLGLRSTFIDSLPDVKFSYLETLDVSHTKIRLLPPSIRPKRHIYLSWFKENWSLHESDVDLQTLWGVYMEDDNATKFLKLIQNLRRLGVKCKSTSVVEKIAHSLPQLTQLQSLKLILEPKDGTLPEILLAKMADSSKLQQLYMHGNLPWNTKIGDRSFPPNLTTLTLSQSNLDDDPLPGLGKLPHLIVLQLFGESYQGYHLNCLSGGFPKLQVLKLWKLPNLVYWTAEKGSMPRLRAIEIRSCRNLSLPELVNVTTLREFVLTNMPPEFDEYVQAIVGSNVYIQKNEWHP